MKITLGEKKQMTQIFREDGSVVPVTIIDVSAVFVGKKRKVEDGRDTVVIVKGSRKKANRADTNQFQNLKVVPKYIKEILVDQDTSTWEEGQELKADLFTLGEKVSVTGTTKGKGFQGVVKRWGFHGGPKTHGQSDRQRAPGSIGSRTTPGRVFRGKKMGGHMGVDVKTIKNLTVELIDVENGLLAIKGAIPGAEGSFVVIKSNK